MTMFMFAPQGLEGATLDEDGVGRVAGLPRGGGEGAGVGSNTHAAADAGVEGSANILRS